MSGSQPIGKIKVSMTLLAGLLRIPEGCKVQAVSQHFCDLRRGYFEVYVSGEGLPDATDKAEVPSVRAVFEGGKIQRFEEIK